jgi:hypothetical protein
MVEGQIYASSMVMLDSAQRKAPVPVPALARWLLGLGIAATLAANAAHGLGHSAVGATMEERAGPGLPPALRAARKTPAAAGRTGYRTPGNRGTGVR